MAGFYDFRPNPAPRTPPQASFRPNTPTNAIGQGLMQGVRMPQQTPAAPAPAGLPQVKFNGPQLPVAGMPGMERLHGGAAESGGNGMLGFLNGNLGQSLISAVGSGLVAAGQGRQNSQDRAERAREFDAELALRRAQAVTGADPLGATQDFAGRSLARYDFLKNYKPLEFSGLPEGIASRMPQMSNRPGAGGFSEDVLRAFSPEATAQSVRRNEANLDLLAPGRTGVTYSSMFSPAVAQPLDDERSVMLDALNAAAAGPQQAPDGYEYDKSTGQLKKKSSLLGKIGKGLLMAAPFVAAPFTGGASLAAISAGAGAASGALNGGGWKGALLGGAMGAIPTGGGLAAGAARPSLQTGLKQAGMSAMRNPNLALALLGGRR